MRIRALRDWTVKSICGHIRFMRTKRQVVAQKPLTPRGAATRARIVEAAAQLVGDRGVAGTSLDDIMAASQTSKSQLYHYFADKDALVCAVVEAQAGKVIGFQESCLKNVRSLADLRKWRDAVVKLNGEDQLVEALYASRPMERKFSTASAESPSACRRLCAAPASSA